MAQTRTLTIADTDSLSGALDLTNLAIRSLIVPKMTAGTVYLAPMTCATVAGTYQQVQDESGNGRLVTVSAAAGRTVEVDSWLGRGLFLKLEARQADGTTVQAQTGAKAIVAVCDRAF